VKLDTIVLSSLLLGMLSVSANAADLTASGVTPYLYFDDTGSSTPHTWKVAGQRTLSNTYFYIENMEAARDVFRINDASGEGLNAFISDSSGDINLADGSMFLDKSANYLGIGTSTPEAEIHVKPGGSFSLFGSSTATVKLDAATTSDWSLTASKFTSLFTGITTNSFYLRDNNASTIPFVVNSGAPSYSLAVSPLGNIGLGTRSPQEKLDVLAKEDGARLVLTSIGDTTYEAPQFTSRRAGSNGSGVIENTKNLDVMGTFAWRGHDGTNWTGAKALFWVRADGDWSSTSTGTTVEIRQTPKNSTTALVAMQIKNHADVYFPNGNLYVKGSKMNVPDYVFKDGYKLMPLYELMSSFTTLWSPSSRSKSDSLAA